MRRLDEIIETFQSAEREMRLELLLDFADRLPPLPAEFRAARDAGLDRVPECQTPVFLRVQLENGLLRIYVHVGEEAPTVKGFVAILVKAFDGSTPDEAARAPSNLLNRLGLSELIRMTRTVGLSAILARIKREAARADGTVVADRSRASAHALCEEATSR